MCTGHQCSLIVVCIENRLLSGIVASKHSHMLIKVVSCLAKVPIQSVF